MGGRDEEEIISSEETYKNQHRQSNDKHTRQGGRARGQGQYCKEQSAVIKGDRSVDWLLEIDGGLADEIGVVLHLLLAHRLCRKRGGRVN
jgi:hypothetical protein